MDKLFLQIINMSITGSYVILFVIIARLLLKKCPKIFSYALWSVVLFRLICPSSIEGIFSFIPVKIVVTTIAVIIVGAGLMLNPKDTESKLSNSNVEPLETNYTTVFMTENENGIESAQINISDTEDINKLYSLIQGGIGSYKNSTVDVSYGKEYIHISFQPSDGLSDYFMYEEDKKYYLVQPYNGKWKISYDRIKEIVTMFTPETNNNDITSATVVEDIITAHFDTIMSNVQSNLREKKI